jgi:hypothetical protein
MRKYHLQKTFNKTLCGVNVKNDNIVVDINNCTCKNCNKDLNNVVTLWEDYGLLDNLPDDKKPFIAYMFEEAKDIMMGSEIHTNEKNKYYNISNYI